MLIWLASALAITGIIGVYSRKKSEKGDIYQVIAACLSATVFGTAGIEFLEYAPSQKNIDIASRAKLSKIMAESTFTASQPITIVEEPKEYKNDYKPINLQWSKISEIKYDLIATNIFTQTKTSPFISYRSEFMNKTDKIIVGIELEVLARNCGHIGGTRKNCPIERGPTVDQITNILIPPNQHLPIGTYATIDGEAGNYEMEVSVKRVAYYTGAWPRNGSLIASSDYKQK